MQRAPAVKDIDLTTAKVYKEFLETPKDIVGLLCIEASRHDHVTSDQEDNFDLCIHAGACREDELVVCVPSCDLICHFMELVDVDQRTWHATLCPYINIIVACQCRGHGNDDVLDFQRVLCHLLSLLLGVKCDVQTRVSTKKRALCRIGPA